MSAAVALQQAIYTKLAAHSGLTTLLASSAEFGSPSVPAIYDRAPQSANAEDASVFPYVLIGDDTAIEWDTDDKDGQESTVTIHSYARASRGKRAVKLVMDQVYDALHKATLSVTGHTALYCYYEFSDSVIEPDGLTAHGVTRFRVVTRKN